MLYKINGIHLQFLQTIVTSHVVEQHCSLSFNSSLSHNE
jgi:hypothetical protein